jgi:hypothetical protein
MVSEDNYGKTVGCCHRRSEAQAKNLFSHLHAPPDFSFGWHGKTIRPSFRAKPQAAPGIQFHLRRFRFPHEMTHREALSVSAPTLSVSCYERLATTLLLNFIFLKKTHYE